MCGSFCCGNSLNHANSPRVAPASGGGTRKSLPDEITHVFHVPAFAGKSASSRRPTIVIGMSSLTEATPALQDIRGQRVLEEQIRLLYSNANVSSVVT